MAESALDALFDQAADAHREGDLAMAEQLCREIVAADPRHLRALFALATIEFDRGHHDAAESLAARIATIDPMIADAHLLRGSSLAALGRSSEAADAFGAAAALMRDPAVALYNQATLLYELGRFDEALRVYDAALACEPGDAVTHNNRGNVLRELRRNAEALAAYDRAIALDPGYADAFNNRGIVLQSLDRAPDALASFDRAIALAPDRADIFYNRGIALNRLGRLTEALENLDRAVALDPRHTDAASEAFGVAATLCDWQVRERRTADLATRIRRGEPVAPFVVLGMADDPALQAQAAKIFAQRYDNIAAAATPSPKHHQQRSRLRIAYLSADFRNHVVGHTLAPLIERHDRAGFEVWGISLSPAPVSDIRRRIAAAVDHFVDAAGWSDRAVADYLQTSEIDVAIDLMGHTQNGRLGIFAHRSAPLQVNYFGYPGTSGARFIDYIIADRIALPERLKPHFTEQVVYLPDTYLAADTSDALNAPLPSRASLGLPETGFVFCNFNTSYKITPAVFDIWMRLLDQIAGSVLWLYAGEATQGKLRREAQARGIDPNRLIFARAVERAAHLSRMRVADLFLDTVPYNAHNTASEALWAGLPLATVTGDAFAARVATSVLAAAGIPELATDSLAAYETLALDLARHPENLAAMRAKIAEQRTSCALFDSARYRRHLETAYHVMGERHRLGLKPESFAVAESL